MAGYRTTNRGGFDTAPFQKILYWVVLVFSVALIFPLIWKLIRKFIQNEQDSQADDIAENPQRLSDILEAYRQQYFPNLPYNTEFYLSRAKQIYTNLGIVRHWWEWLLPSRWFENDKKVYVAYMSATGGVLGDEHDFLAYCYQMYSGSAKRDLLTDMAKHLDTDYQEIMNPTGWEQFNNQN